MHTEKGALHQEQGNYVTGRSRTVTQEHLKKKTAETYIIIVIIKSIS